MKEGPTQHLLLRGKRRIDIDGSRTDIVDAHNDHFKKSKLVALGKFGRAPSRSKLEQLQTQIKDKQKTKLYLVYREKGEFTAVVATIAKVVPETEEPASKQKPAFYLDSLDLPSLWVLLE